MCDLRHSTILLQTKLVLLCVLDDGLSDKISTYQLVATSQTFIKHADEVMVTSEIQKKEIATKIIRGHVSTC